MFDFCFGFLLWVLRVELRFFKQSLFCLPLFKMNSWIPNTNLQNSINETPVTTKIFSSHPQNTQKTIKRLLAKIKRDKIFARQSSIYTTTIKSTLCSTPQKITEVIWAIIIPFKITAIKTNKRATRSFSLSRDIVIQERKALKSRLLLWRHLHNCENSWDFLFSSIFRCLLP